MPIYGVDDEMIFYFTNKNDRQWGIFNLPNEVQRLKDQEIAGSKDLTLVSKPSSIHLANEHSDHMFGDIPEVLRN